MQSDNSCLLIAGLRAFTLTTIIDKTGFKSTIL